MLANWASALLRTDLLLVIAIQLVLIASNGRAEGFKTSPIDVESDRLPSNVVPLEYNVEMMFMNNKGAHGRGRVEILFKVNGPSKADSLLRLVGKKHAKNDQNDRLVLHLRHNIFEIAEIDVVAAETIDAARSRDGQRLEIKELQVNEYYRLLVIQLDRSLREGSFGSIVLSYRIKDTANELQNSKQNPLVHGHPGEVYRLFPCLDEPHLKSKLTLTIDQPDPNTRIVANMEPQSTDTELNWERVTFRQTPVAIPLHSLAFAFVPADKAHKTFYPVGNAAKRMVVVHGSKARLSESQFSMALAASAIKWMEKYFEGKHNLPVDLNLIPIPKQGSQHIGLDAHAGLGFGAINEDIMLIDENTSSSDLKTENAFNVALVVARQWFGTMLTPRTKADWWITEGLASYMAIRMVRELEPELEVDQFFTTVMRRRADGGSLNTHRMRLFKGAQVFDMLRGGVAGGSGKFDSMIRKLFAKQQAVSVEDLAQVFPTEKPEQKKLLESIRSRAETGQFTESYGPDPWVELDIRGSQLVVGLNRVADRGLNLPVSLKLKLSTEDGSKQTVQNVNLDESNSEIHLELPSWFGLHDQATDWLVVSQEDAEALPNFRVRYSDKLLERLLKPLEQGNRLLKPRERIEILGGEIDSLGVDNYNQDKKKSGNRLAKLLGKLAEESQPEVVLEAVRAIDALGAFAGGHRAYLVTRAGNWYRHWIKADTENKASGERLKSALLKLLASNDDRDAIKWALDMFRYAFAGKVRLGAQTEAIYDVVARFGEWEDRNRLAYRLSSGKSREEQVKIFRDLDVADGIWGTSQS